MRKLLRRRWVKIAACIILAPIVLLVSLREYIQWSGERKWAAARQMLAREGESLDLREIAPAPVPDADNFCAIPALKGLAAIPGDVDPKSPIGRQIQRLKDASLPSASGISRMKPAERKEAMQALSSGTALNSYLQKLTKDSERFIQMPRTSEGITMGKRADMKSWVEWIRWADPQIAPPDSASPARDVLDYLSRNDPLIGELAQGLSRPESQWTPAWKTREWKEPLFKNSYPNQATPIQLFISMLGLRAAAAAQAGDAQKARQSVEIALRLDQAEIQEPLVIDSLISNGLTMTDCGAVWELCNSHCGSDEDFRVVQKELQKLNFQKNLLFAYRGEVAFAYDTSEYLKRTRDFPLFNPFEQPGPAKKAAEAAVTRSLPDGFMDANDADLVRLYLSYFIEPLRDGDFKAVLARQNELKANFTTSKSRPFFERWNQMFAIMAMPAMSNVVNKAIYAQCVVNEAIAGCALERYRIEHGAYPAALEEANHPGDPAIPLDVISGKPMDYRKISDGNYALWCVGFDGRDDGGKRGTFKKYEPINFSDPRYQGDWVWDFPAR